jgi:hypothetical protein
MFVPQKDCFQLCFAGVGVGCGRDCESFLVCLFGACVVLAGCFGMVTERGLWPPLLTEKYMGGSAFGMQKLVVEEV